MLRDPLFVEQIMVHQIFQQFLMTALVHWRQVVLFSVLRNFRQRHLPFQNLLAQLTIPTGITFSHALIQTTVFNHTRRNFQRQRHGIHRTNMTIEQIVFIGTLTTNLGIEVQATGGEAAGFQDFVHHQRILFYAVRELISIPAQLRVPTVGIDRAKQTQRDSGGDFVMERVTRQRGVVGFDIQFDLFFQTELLEESVYGRRIVIVLVLGRFLRLRLDKQSATETGFVFVFHDQLHEATNLLTF